MMKKRIQKFIYNITILLFSLVVLIPLMIVLFNSFKDKYEAAKFNLVPPTSLNFDNYIRVFETADIFTAMGNGAFYATMSCTIIVFLSSAAAFIIQRRQTKPTKFIYKAFILGLVLPVSMIPTITLGKTLGIYGTRFNLIMIYSATSIPFCFFMYYNFMKTISRQLDEAVVIDGGGAWMVYTRIILPLLKPVSFTIILINATNFWNDFYWQLYFTNSSKLWGMPMTVYQFFGQYSREWNLVAADIVIAVVPILILFLLFQRQIVDGMTAGALKG